MSDQVQNSESHVNKFPYIERELNRRAMQLQAKGSCWYCDRAVDAIRRFCSVSCRNDYFEEEH
jgi:hypothetical protein